MNKENLTGFADEMQKQAIPLPLMKLLSPVKAWRAGVRGKKSFMRQVDREIKQFKFKDPGFDAASYRTKRLTELETEGRQAVEKALAEGKTPGGGASFLRKHKGKLLVGGAAVGGLYLANKANEDTDEKRRRAAAMRNFNIPQSVYYS